MSALSSRAEVSRTSASFTYNYSPKSSVAAPLPPPASAGTLFAKAQRIQLDRERKASGREAALERRRLDEIEREEDHLWRRVDKLILEKTVATYDEAVGILKNLRDLALHKEREAEFMRRVEAIREKHPRLSGLRRRIEDAKLLEGSKSG